MPSQFSIQANATNQRLYTGIARNALVSDEELMQFAMVKASKDTTKSKTAKLYKAIPYLATAGLTGYYALTKQGPLSSKVATGAAVAGLFTGIDLGFKACRKIKDKIQEKRGGEEPKPDKHPIAKGILGAATAIAAIAAGYVGIKKGASAFAKTDLGGKAVNQLRKLGEKIDAIQFTKKTDANKVAGSIDGFFKKHPAANTALFWTPIVGTLAGTSILGKKLNQKFHKEVDKNFEAFDRERDQFIASAILFKTGGLVGEQQSA